jgi:hypothetical protein
MAVSKMTTRVVYFGLILTTVCLSRCVADARMSPWLGQIPLAQQSPPSPASVGNPAPDVQQLRLEEQRTHLASNERQKRLQTDTDKLLALATELKQEVDKSSKDELSVTALKKATQIEKLAHDIRDKLKE